MGQRYIHGFDSAEQQRLYRQAKFLEPYVYEGVQFQRVRRLLEVGCGVGAQSKILLKRFPKIHIDGVDLASAQLDQASRYLAPEIKKGRVQLHQQDATQLVLPQKYDAAFLCWFLEHVPDPLSVLKKVRENLKPKAEIVCTEVFNSTFFVDPYSPAFLKYWFEFNDYQWTIRGHPFVGAQLGNLLKNAGFREIKTEVRSFHWDSRAPKKRAAFLKEFIDILESAAPALLAAGRVTPELIDEMKKEMTHVSHAKDSVFFWGYVRATARR